MLTFYRTKTLNGGEKKWLKGFLDSKLGLVDFSATESVSEALSSKVVVCLGAEARAVLLNTGLSSTISCRGCVDEFGGVFIITTWDLAGCSLSADQVAEFACDVLKARVYAYGLGNPGVGYVDKVELSDGQIFEVDKFENFVDAYGKAIRGA